MAEAVVAHEGYLKFNSIIRSCEILLSRLEILLGGIEIQRKTM
jgi:hypothetical protein